MGSEPQLRMTPDLTADKSLSVEWYQKNYTSGPTSRSNA